MNNIHLHICIPCYGGQLSEATFSSFVQFTILANKLGLIWTLDTMVNESLITRARNNLVAKMMSSPKASHLLFIDADIRFTADSIIKLLQADKDIVAGAYPIKTLPVHYALNTIPDTPAIGNLQEVKNTATGFMMIKRQVFDIMFDYYPNTKYNDNVGFGKQYERNMYALFDTLVDDNGDYLSEDWTFCKRWKEATNHRGQIWIDNTIKLDHIGHYSFNGDTTQLQELK